MKAALAQLISTKGDPSSNLKKMSSAIKEASAKGADLVCFAELFYSGYDIDKETLENLAVYFDGPETAKIREMAKEYGIHVFFSYPERDRETGKVYISAMLIDDAGNILLNHRKTYRWADEKLKVSAGTGYQVCDTRFGKIGVLICYEMEFPEPARILMLQGAEIVLIASAFSEVNEMHTYLSAIAIQNQFHILSVNDVRDEAPLRGISCVVDQYGKVVSMLSDKEGMLYCDIDLNSRNRRKTDPHMTDLRKDTFEMMAELAGRMEGAGVVEAGEAAEAANPLAYPKSASNAPTRPKPASGTVRKYVKNPVVIEAYQTDEEMIIHTLEGDLKAMPGDYIITGIEDEQYPCKPDIFEKTYEEIIEDK
jgi:predicted amidohydrolase